MHRWSSAATDVRIGEAFGPNELIALNHENLLHKRWRAKHTFGTTGYGSWCAIGDSQPNPDTGGIYDCRCLRDASNVTPKYKATESIEA